MRNVLRTVLSEDVKKIFDQFSQCFGVRIVFYNADGELLTEGQDCPDCEYCRLVQQKLYGEQPCQEMNASGRAAASSKTMVRYQCHAGLLEVVVPVVMDGHVLGYAMIGQLRLSPQMPAPVARSWSTQYADDALINAYRALPLLSKERLDAVLGFFGILIEHIVAKQMVFVQGDPDLSAVLTYMRENVREPLTLTQAAEHVGRSPFSLSHAFAKHLGQSFKQTLIEMKLSRAEELMQSDPRMTVTRAAEEVGYLDPYYFCRLYKKYRGSPPSSFLQSQRQRALLREQ